MHSYLVMPSKMATTPYVQNLECAPTWELTHWWLLELLCIYCMVKEVPWRGCSLCEGLASHWYVGVTGPLNLGHPLHLIWHKEWDIIYLQNIWQEMKRREKKGANQGFLFVNFVGFESLVIFFWICTKNLKICKIVCSHSAKIHPKKKHCKQPSIKLHTTLFIGFHHDRVQPYSAA